MNTLRGGGGRSMFYVEILAFSGRLRIVEWVIVAHFSYVALLTAFFPLSPAVRWLPPFFPAVAYAAFRALAEGEAKTGFAVFARVRDWLALGFTLTAYRQMDWFTPAAHTGRLEKQWIVWDRWFLHDLGVKAGIEAAGTLAPSLLELSYLLVYLSAPFALTMLYVFRRAERAPAVLLFYVTGTLAAYACFPWFPSEPPRTVFRGEDLPLAAEWVRRSNLFVVGGYGIHSSVFPSAHVSSGLSAAFGLLCALPERRGIGIGMFLYASVMALATVYGRYHYLVDAVAGVAVALTVRFFLLRYIRVECGADPS